MLPRGFQEICYHNCTQSVPLHLIPAHPRAVLVGSQNWLHYKMLLYRYIIPTQDKSIPSSYSIMAIKHV